MQGTTISLGSSNAAAIDTGTTLIGGPQAVVAAIYAAIPGSQLMGSSYPNYYEYPCSTDINFQVTFGTFTVTITNADFNIGRYSSDQTMCTGGVYIQALSSSSPVQWVVGDTLLKNTYTVFRSSPAAVGFAALPGAVVASAAAASTGIPNGSVLPNVIATTNVAGSSSASVSSATSKSGASASTTPTQSGTLSSMQTIGVASSTSPDGTTVTGTVTAGATAATSKSSGAGRQWQLASNGAAIISIIALFITGSW
jgi:cathepsin D